MIAAWLLLLVVPGAAPPSDSAERALAFARSFYAWYLEQGEPRTVEQALRLEQVAFAPALYAALDADVAARAAAGEATGLDFDPFLNSQDPAPSYDVREPAGDGSGTGHRIPIYANRGDGKNSNRAPDVTTGVVCSASACQFENFYYRRDNLVAVLKTLAAERKKPRRTR